MVSFQAFPPELNDIEYDQIVIAFFQKADHAVMIDYQAKRVVLFTKTEIDISDWTPETYWQFICGDSLGAESLVVLSRGI
jgi:hypothetical protein